MSISCARSRHWMSLWHVLAALFASHISHADATDVNPADSAPETRRYRPAWQAKLATYSIASVARREGRRDWNEVTQGNKVVLPREVYEYLTSRNLPIDKFQLLNPERKRALRLFTGPLDFCAPSGECYLPSWVMRQLGIKEGDVCAVATANFPAAAYIKFQAHTSDFLDIGDHTAVLTRTIENLGGLTKGSYVRVSDGRRTYTLDVLDVRGKPMPPQQRDDSQGKAVSIGLLECPIEFAEPKDIAAKAKKPPPPPPPPPQEDGEGEGGGDVSAAPAADDGDARSRSSTAEDARGPRAASDAAPTGRGRGGGAAASRRSAQVGRASGSAASSNSNRQSTSGSEAAPAAPVPKFKRRKAAATGEGETLSDSPFTGRARALGSSDGGGSDTLAHADASIADSNPTTSRGRRTSATAASALARRRAAAKQAPSVAVGEGADEAEDAEEAGDVAGVAPPGLVLVLTKALTMLRALLVTILNAIRRMLTPDVVSFD